MASYHESEDTVYPTHMIDNASVLKSLVMAWTMRFNDVLDADKLHKALTELLTIGDWKKLGGRLKVGHNRNGALEVHVPSSFSEERPAIYFSHDHYQISIEEHERGRWAIKATDRPSLYPASSSAGDYACLRGAPTSLKDFTRRDVPMINLYIATFQNATLVTVTWPHALFDGGGFCHLLEAWSLVMAEQKEKIPDLLGAKEDVLYNIGDIAKSGTHYTASESRVLSGLSFIFFLLRFLWVIITQPTIDSRVICLPKHTVENLHQRALKDLEDEVGDPWVSPADAILAWVSRAVNPRPSRPITMTTTIDARTRISELQGASGVYVQNMVLGSFATISPDDFRGPLGKQALVNRRGLLDQLQETNLIGILQLLRKRWDSGNHRAPIFAAPGTDMFMTNNRLKINIFKAANFRSAVLQASKQRTRSNPLGTPVYQYASALDPGIAFRNFVTVHTKDYDGNYWLSGFFTPQQWSNIEEGLNQDLIT
ncbi:hypothetical protein F53441_10319 [Fusarium austroafricanum]|uniref:Uncharacterized protein n=1 Tax=Fusarium austroafricanum TaxID=2364996 RepID=A0A8H4K946_9HYPO|nr:hypothetical protein F53441_10319 [Fusarium austroafricanum]